MDREAWSESPAKGNASPNAIITSSTPIASASTCAKRATIAATASGKITEDRRMRRTHGRENTAVRASMGVPVNAAEPEPARVPPSMVAREPVRVLPGTVPPAKRAELAPVSMRQPKVARAVAERRKPPLAERLAVERRKPLLVERLAAERRRPPLVERLAAERRKPPLVVELVAAVEHHTHLPVEDLAEAAEPQKAGRSRSKGSRSSSRLPSPLTTSGSSPHPVVAC
jgi:hypothetical protein